MPVEQVGATLRGQFPHRPDREPLHRPPSAHR
ncbi:hypothetical protein BJ999_007631 [Actinomadura citrea]|uniref:Uncharacterized protein n=1 Tax=Actinomadura citrea TaxID=46158 RepID=A0A7Y9KH47_9ACTN|nr:hypothetical protein [Actinomadura citrea]